MDFGNVEEIKKNTTDIRPFGALRRSFEEDFLEGNFHNIGRLYELNKGGKKIVSGDCAADEFMCLYQCKETENLCAMSYYSSSRDNKLEFGVSFLEIGEKDSSGLRKRIEGFLFDFEEKNVLSEVKK